MRVHIDSEKCEGHNRCVSVASELFDSDDYGYAFVLGRGEVAPEQEEAARLAVANCPERAVSIVEAAT